MTQINLRDQLYLGLIERDLDEYRPFCEQMVDAYHCFPEFDSHDLPEKQLTDFLSRADELTGAELKIRFKHEISKLRAFSARAFKFVEGEIEFFNPLVQTFQDFTQTGSDVSTYLTVSAFPCEDIIIKAIEHSVKA